ncbi:MAG TPA: 50S ribosomal protein L29 [bacterium]|uniref:Large ribosomal subunit protein uL29 n=1 Tax=uncultured bacterium Rifle_16ft_4_minimus_4564 TaxID=1665161 RepID=A0A0H4TTR7_9BACT|nr:LSU ribosomal protein L29P [uncultured bacterium Rifle_16ft_4_minimus_4564]
MKAKELREMTVEELELKEKEFSQQYFNARIKHSAGQLQNPVQLRILRRSIARIKTLLRLKKAKGQGG